VGDNDFINGSWIDCIPSNVEPLKNGIVNISNSKTSVSYNILLVGETGVGKSSLVELIANILTGNDIDHYNFEILDHTNGQGGSDHQTQTNSARVYELTSKNGIVVSSGVDGPKGHE
jgi:energy-coupling factor transporter ATP-binding protein EcfA2